MAEENTTEEQNTEQEVIQEPEVNAGQEQVTEEKTNSLLSQAMGDNQGQAQKQEQVQPYELNIPKGMTLEDSQRTLFEKQARDMGLDNATAQKLLDISQVNQKAYADALQAQVKAWQEEVTNDSELGGANLTATLAHAKSGLTRFDPDLKIFGLLEESGYSNHPEVIRFLSAIGKAHGEDQVVEGGKVPVEVPLHERMFGKYNKIA